MAEASSLRPRLPRLAKYDVLEEIGHGGMATVYRARDRRLGREVAVKVVHPHLRDSREVVSRFKTEATAVAKLRHPNVVEVFDVSEPDEAEQYLVVELVRGTTLRKVLQAHGAMPPEVAAALALEILSGLAHAHASGVVHRDIKPENVLIELRPPTEHGSPWAVDGAGALGAPAAGDPAARASAATHPHGRVVVKLADFGIAKLLDSPGVTSTGQVLGSPAHMAPEQIDGGQVDVRSDLFGLGVLLYECMVGHLPFQGSNPAQVLRRVLEGQYPEAQVERPVVGSRWSTMLDRALARTPAGRFPDAGSMREAFMQELHRLGVEEPRAELERWLDDSDAYAAPHARRMVDALCALAVEGRRRGEVLSAASDCNRALAHAPDDPQLMHLVAGMGRANARARVLRKAHKAGVVGALVLAFGAVALAGQTWWRAHSAAGGPEPGARQPDGPATTTFPRTPEPDPPPSPSLVAPPVASPIASTVGEGTPRVSAPAGPSHAAVPRSPAPGSPGSAPQPSARAVERTLMLDLTPSMGIQVSVDGDRARHVSTGDPMVLDTRAHALTFACAVCITVQRVVAAGDKDETLKVVVPIKPAILVIQGDPSKTYQIIEHPEIAVRAGATTVELRGVSFERATVEQIETGKVVQVRLEAGQQSRPAVF